MKDGEARSNGKQVLDDIQAFPILTSDVDHGRIQQPKSAGTASIGYLAESALRDILSIRPTTTDPKSFVAALNTSFTASEADGRTIWQWVPRSFTVQADMGEVTGAQASIHARAKFAFDQCVILLEGLASLRADADTEDVNATRAIIRSHLLELVNELGTVGGPRVQRVDALFAALLGPKEDIKSPDEAKGLLGSIRDRFGLTRDRVNTIDEEQNLTNFLILVDHVIALRLSWNAQRGFFDRRGKDVFLGTQLVLLGRALEVIAESVHEAEFVMDSVLLGPAERQTLDLNFKKKLNKDETTLKVAELLSWIERFAAQEGPGIIREAGKDGVIALVPTLKQLSKLVGYARDISRQNSDNPLRGFHTPRVQRAMDELDQHIRAALRLANTIQRAPIKVRSIDKPSADPSSFVPLFIFGENFQQGATALLRRSGDPNTTIKATQTHFVSQGSLQATFDLQGQPTGSVWDVIVINPDDTDDRGKKLFKINSDAFQDSQNRSRAASQPATNGFAPQVSGFNPPLSSNANADDVLFQIEGNNFSPNAEVLLVRESPAGSFRIEPKDIDTISGNGKLIRATFNLYGLRPGYCTLLVVNPDGAVARAEEPFMITSPLVEQNLSSKRFRGRAYPV